MRAVTTAIKSNVVQLDAGWFKPCDSLEHASQLVSEYIREFMMAGYGSSDWYNRSGNNGKVFDTEGKAIAYISWNGRIWSMDGEEIIS